MLKTLVTFATFLFSAGPLFADSYYADRLDDAKAIYLTRDKFPVHGDGVADDSDALQQAINKVQQTSNQGILFLPSGRYRVTKTIYMWPGIRVIGYGETRPVLVLGRNTLACRARGALTGKRNPAQKKLHQTPVRELSTPR